MTLVDACGAVSVRDAGCPVWLRLECFAATPRHPRPTVSDKGKPFAGRQSHACMGNVAFHCTFAIVVALATGRQWF